MARQWEDAPEETGAPAGLHEAVRQTESAGSMSAVSPKGATSDMQVMPATARQPGLGVTPAKDASLSERSRVGHDYLDALYKKYDNPEHALVAYNWGPSNADKWIAEGADPKKLPKETRDYVAKVQGQARKGAERKWEDAPEEKAQREKPGVLGEVAKATGRNLVSVADMLLSVPGMALGVVAGDIPGRIAAGVMGATHRQQGEFAQEQYHKIADPSAHLVTDALARLGYDSKDPSQVDAAMGKLGALLDKGGEYIEKHTGGALTKEDVQSLTNEVMAFGGAKGAVASAKGVGKALAKRVEKPAVAPDFKVDEATGKMHDAAEVEEPVREPGKKEVAETVAKQTSAIKELTEVPFNELQKRIKDIKAAKGTVTQHEVGELFDRVKRGETKPAPKPEEMPAVFRDRKAQQVEAAWQQRAKETGQGEPRQPRSVEQAIREAVGDAEAPLAPPLGPMQQAFKEFTRNQRGEVDPRYLQFLAATSAGAIAGSYLSDDPKEGALLGAALTAGGIGAIQAAGKLAQNFRGVLGKVADPFKDTRYRIDTLRRDRQGTYNSIKLGVFRVSNTLQKLVPDKARRSELSYYVEGTDPQFAPRTVQEQTYVKTLQDAYRDLGQAGQQFGVFDKLVQEGSYITHLYGATGEALKRAKSAFSNMSPNSRFALTRAFPTLRAAEKAGFKPLTTDSAEIFGVYGNTLSKTLANAKFLNQLKTGMHPEGRPLITGVKGAPPDYVGINHPQLQGKVVHPDIAPTMKLLFELDEPGAITQGLEAVAAAAKRSLFSFSMFHAMALTEALIAKNPNLINPLKAVGEWKKVWNASKMYREGKLGDEVDKAVSAGLRLEPRAGVDVSTDVLQRAAQKVLDSSAGWFSKGRAGIAAAGAGVGYLMSGDEDKVSGMLAGAALAYGGGRKGLQAAKAADAALNKFLWEKLHPAYKIATFMSEKEKFLAENAKRVQRGEAPLAEGLIDREVANHVNDIFGGINWGDIAEGVQNRYGRAVMGQLASTGGQRAMRIGLTAPDWLFSTVRSTGKAFPGVGTEMSRQMARQYVASSALMYLTVGDALNYHFSGHHLWENKDPTTIDLGDGRRMQLNKHFMELAHIVRHPGVALGNKLGYVPRTLGEILLDRRKSSQQIAKDALTGLLPIPAQGVLKGEQGGSPLAGFLGLPIYGKTEEQKLREKEMKEFERLTREPKGEEE